MSIEVVRNFFAYFGIFMLIAIIDFATVLILAFSDKLDSEYVYFGGFVVNALALSVILPILILGR